MMASKRHFLTATLLVLLACTQVPASAQADDNTPNSGTSVQDKTSEYTFKLAVEKLSHREQLSAEEYRSLGVGCTGIESIKILFGRAAIVTKVLHGSPADQAGIRVGDRQIWHNARVSVDRPLQVNFSRAGEPVDITIIRHGQPKTFSLINMNIEDLPEARDRSRWEALIRAAGYPSGGQIFTGTSTHDLKESD